MKHEIITGLKATKERDQEGRLVAPNEFKAIQENRISDAVDMPVESEEILSSEIKDA